MSCSESALLWTVKYVSFLAALSTVHSITFPPSFTKLPPRNAVFIPGEAILLPCVAIGSPAPKYVWFKNGKYFNWAANTGRYTKWPDEGTLVIARPGTDDDGIYQCQAINQFGEAWSNTVNVKRAELGEFDTTSEKVLHVSHGKSVMLPCNVPLGYPPPVVTWQTERNSQIQYIKETNRHATDINGYLYIAAVTYDDHDTLYTCVANNEVLRRQVNGPSYRIRVTGQVTNYPLTNLYRTPRTEVAIEGEVLRLKCIFGGYPEPQYTWFKEEKEQITLPNVNVQNMGTMLEFNPVTLDAAGNYRCQGTNEQTLRTLNSQYTVQVQVRPTFIDKPEDITVPVNGTIIFKCTARGIPAPQIRWTVNGQDPSFYIDGVRKLLRGNTMALYNLTIKDTAVIQCNASNAFGYDYVNAYVNVMREPPYFIKPPQQELRVVSGNNITLNCQTFSAPKAVISWLKDGRPINGGRYKSLDTGDLFIESAALTDSGVYECVATNPFGSRKASGRVLVRRQTRIVLRPIPTQVYEGQVVKFLCTAETDPSELQNLQITWYKDNNLIQPDLTPRIQKVWFDYSLVLSGAQPRDTGQYRCNASNGLDFDVATASLLVQGRPEQALSVQVNCVDFVDEELALVTWYPGSDNYAPIMEYMVEYSTQYERQTWYPAEIFNYTGLVQSTSIKVILRPAILYQFRVRTKNRVGVSLPSNPTTTECGIPPRVPATNPKELYIYGSMQGNLILKWTTLPYIEHYGNNLGYILTIACLNCDRIRPDAINNTVIGDWRTDSITLTSFRVGREVYEIEVYKRFRATIQSRNEKGVSTAQPTIAYGFSGGSVPTLAPPAPTILSATGRGAELQWRAITEVEEQQIKGYFRGYRVEWCDSTLNTVQCESNKRFQDFILRIPNTPILYTRRRRSLDEINHEKETIMERYRPTDTWTSDLEDSFVCRSTPRRNISCPGAGIYPRAAQSRSIIGDAYGAVLTRTPRQINMYPKQSSVGSQLPNFIYGGLVNFTLTGVPGNTTIRLWTRILTDRFAGQMSPVVSFTTLEDIPGPVGNLQATTVSVAFADITWTPPSEPNGVVLGYEFQAMELKGLETGFGFRYPTLHNGSAINHRLSRLRPNTTYRLTVWAFTSAGLGTDNFIDVTTAPSDIAPNPPNFVVSTVSTNNFTVMFEPSHTGIPGTVFFVQYRQPGVIHWLDTPPTFSERVIVVTALMADTSYQVRLVATNGGELSTATEDRLVHTLGGPGPDSLAGPSGTWFIIVCVLLVFFFVVLALLVLIRVQRLTMVRKKAVESTGPLIPVVPDYTQSGNDEERRRLLSPASDIRSLDNQNSQQLPGHEEPLEDDDGWLPSETDETTETDRLPPPVKRPSSRRWDNDADLVEDRGPSEFPLRSREEEAELELNGSYVDSGDDLDPGSRLPPTHPLSQPRYRTQASKSSRRPISPQEMSQASQISGDPTLI